jgi:hypothetical protein
MLYVKLFEIKIQLIYLLNLQNDCKKEENTIEKAKGL